MSPFKRTLKKSHELHKALCSPYLYSQATSYPKAVFVKYMTCPKDPIKSGGLGFRVPLNVAEKGFRDPSTAP